MNQYSEGQFFPDKLLSEIREKFSYVEVDPIQNKNRIFFDNAGGSFRLTNAEEKFTMIDSIPDSPVHENATAQFLADVLEKGKSDIRTIFNAKGGSIATYLTASQGIFDVTGVIAENIPGKNIVTTALEHPSAYDSAKYYAKKLGKGLRVAKVNPDTGGIDVEEIIKLIDKDTSLLSVIYASNISGAILDIETIVTEARKINPDLYIIVDAVQHAPHGVIDIEKTPVDAMNIAPYKFFGVRGYGIVYLSDRTSRLPHHRLLDKSQDEWELGSPAPSHFAAISEIVDYVCWIGSKFITGNDRRELFVEGMNKITLHERRLLYSILDGTDNRTGLRNMNGVTVQLDSKDLSKRDFIIAISIAGMDFKDAVRQYEDLGIIVYERVSTNVYSKRILESFGMKGAVRISPLHCNSVEEIEQFLEVTEKLVKDSSF